ncbi:hypothetical protein AG1IA_10471 [Rhizoctonia solani AG-1 IA]|uniref:Uncharacterized protein n=1 Tax=Thanatephorus cucumeris (strain AG1-IA) TaxID=983506 RepID=L8WGH1_THACA|nr:hypothetical protein AG1IA_10471 [Rhizoctonia solani AG-1 IA]
MDRGGIESVKTKANQMTHRPCRGCNEANIYTRLPRQHELHNSITMGIEYHHHPVVDIENLKVLDTKERERASERAYK